jgi:3-deoxy-D-arabino-heptulosonate 7-phosphate (DAHP) synthase class II
MVVWEELTGGEVAGCVGGYSGGGSFQLEQFYHCRPTVWTWRALSLEFARRHEGFGGMPIASFLRVVDISFE